MRIFLRSVWLLLTIPGFAYGQTAAHPADSSTSTPDVGTQLDALREALSQTQRQVAAQQQEIQILKAQLKGGQPGTGGAALVSAAEVVRPNPTEPNVNPSDSSSEIHNGIANPVGRPTDQRKQQDEQQSPVGTIKLGDAVLTPGGFVDFENIFRNPLTNRLRLYFAYVKRGNWEFLGGQTWSWLTPNREGIGPMPSDLAITYNEDQNLAVGIPYTRAAELRAAYHVNEHWAIGIGIEDSNQFIGNFVALPSHFSTIGLQFDNNANAGAANLMPDIIAKSTYDTHLSSRHFHAEVTGFLTGAHASVMPIGSTSFQTRTEFGGGGEVAMNYELVPNKLVVLANGFLERWGCSLPCSNRAATRGSP